MALARTGDQKEPLAAVPPDLHSLRAHVHRGFASPAVPQDVHSELCRRGRGDRVSDHYSGHDPAEPQGGGPAHGSDPRRGRGEKAPFVVGAALMCH